MTLFCSKPGQLPRIAGLNQSDNNAWQYCSFTVCLLSKKVRKNNSLSKPKNALSAADHFCHKQCSNTDITTNWLRSVQKRANYLNTFKHDKVSLLNTTDNLPYISALFTPSAIILWSCQTSMPVIYILIRMTLQHDIINETTESDVQ